MKQKVFSWFEFPYELYEEGSRQDFFLQLHKPVPLILPTEVAKSFLFRKILFYVGFQRGEVLL